MFIALWAKLSADLIFSRVDELTDRLKSDPKIGAKRFGRIVSPVNSERNSDNLFKLPASI